MYWIVQPPHSVKLSNPLSSYSFSYDYIGRLETMSDDVSTLFNLLNLTFPFPTLSGYYYCASLEC